MDDQTSVQVLYNYDYNTAEGKHITINKGDIFTLLSKATEEWWKVKRGEKDKFYVPANYVKVIDKVKSLSNGRTQSGSLDSLNQSSASGESDGREIDKSTDNTNALYMNSSMLSLSLHNSRSENEETIQPETNGLPSPVHEQVEYANMAMIQEIIQKKKKSDSSPSSTTSSNQESWEMHTDDDSGKIYYFNASTKETTWDSPVLRRKNHKDFNENAQKRLSRVTSFRKGWTETVSDDGSKVYVHNATGDKWHTAIDHSGRSYYYKENGGESLWDLPEGGFSVKSATAVNGSFDKHKKGHLYKAKICEGGRKVKKKLVHWVYSGDSLKFDYLQG